MRPTTDESTSQKPFREGLFRYGGGNIGHLIGSRCDRCNITFFPTRSFCTNCFADDQITEVTLSKTGHLHTYTTVYQSRPGFKVPYSIGFVDLEEGVRIFAPLFEVAAEELKIGLEMDLVFRNVAGVSGQEEEALVYGFKPAAKQVND